MLADLVKKNKSPAPMLADPSMVWNYLKSVKAEDLKKCKEMGCHIWFGAIAR